MRDSNWQSRWHFSRTESSEGYRCERCGKVFTYRYYRDKHLRYTPCVDMGDRKFPCSLCKRSFEKRDRLRIHVLHVHEKHRPHKVGVSVPTDPAHRSGVRGPSAGRSEASWVQHLLSVAVVGGAGRGLWCTVRGWFSSFYLVNLWNFYCQLNFLTWENSVCLVNTIWRKNESWLLCSGPKLRHFRYNYFPSACMFSTYLGS